MEKRILGHTTFNQSFHRATCSLCGETGKIVGSSTSRDDVVKKIISHMETEHSIRASEFAGVVYENRMGRPPISDEETESVGVRLPKSVIAKIPEPRSTWIRDLIMTNISG